MWVARVASGWIWSSVPGAPSPLFRFAASVSLGAQKGLILLFIHYARIYGADAWGSVLHRVECENCAAEYFYVLHRVSHGSGTSHYGLNNNGAMKGARDEAQAALESTLSKDIEPVPCPKCGFLQSYMVEMLRQSTGHTAFGIGCASALLLLAAGLIVLMQTDARWGKGLGAGALLAAVVALMAGSRRQQILVRRVEEDRGENAARERFPFCPPAMVRARTCDLPAQEVNDDQIVLVPARDLPKMLDDKGRAIVQMGRYTEPDACVLCLKPTTRKVRQPFPIDMKKQHPCCAACARGLWWRSVARFVGWLALLYTALSMGIRLIPSLHREEQIALMVIGAIPLAVAFAWVLTGLMSTPVHVRTLEQRTGTLAVWGKNPRYAELLAASAAKEFPRRLVISKSELNAMCAAPVSARIN